MDAYDFAAARHALLGHFERCAAWLNHTAPHSTYVDQSDPTALILRIGARAHFTFRETRDGPVYAWWYPASPRPTGEHDIVGDPVPVVREAVLRYMRRARSELG